LLPRVVRFVVWLCWVRNRWGRLVRDKAREAGPWRAWGRHRVVTVVAGRRALL
jgi:hypothetical protein